MKTRIFVIVTFIIILIMITPIVTSHVPIESGDNDTLNHALHIERPLKSWAIYDELEHGSEARYYEVELKKGDRLKISVFTPEEGEFSPGIVIMGPNFSKNSTVPQFIEVPEGFGTIMVHGERSEHAEYEPFTPSSTYFTAEFDEEVNQSGVYYFAVFESVNSGKFGVAVGYIESFSVKEWLLIPYDVINIHLWEGQNIALILAPLIVIFGTGKIFLFYRRIKLNKPPSLIYEWLGSIAALLYIGTGFMILMQMGIALSKSGASVAAVVTLIFAAIPIALGVLILKFSIKDEAKLTIKNRIKIFIFGVLGLILWAGLIVGPIIIFVVSFLPGKFKKNQN
jgi:hypothetical protein